MGAAQQYELLMAPKPNPQPVSDEAIYLCKDKIAAIRLGIAASGLEEKQIYLALQLDKATWSKIMSGQLNWPTDGDEKFEAIVGNNILTIWQMYRRGYKKPEPRQSEHERIIAELQSKVAEMERDNRLMRELLTSRR